MPNKTVISVKKPTPTWATWVFRVVFILCGIAAYIVAGDKAIPAETAVRVMLYLTAIDRGVWLLSRAIGVDEDPSKWKIK